MCLEHDATIASNMAYRRLQDVGDSSLATFPVVLQNFSNLPQPEHRLRLAQQLFAKPPKNDFSEAWRAMQALSPHHEGFSYISG
ncbi:MAG: hypothetical protein QW794_08800 [Thermosphaera sp.]